MDTSESPSIGFNEQPVYLATLCFGHKTASGEPIPRSAIIAALTEVTADLNTICGGCQIYRHRGSYRHIDGSDCDETATTVSALGISVDIPQERLVVIASRLADRLKQASVMVTVERFAGSVLFITPHGLA